MGHWLLTWMILREVIMQLGYHYQKPLRSVPLQYSLLTKVNSVFFETLRP